MYRLLAKADAAQAKRDGREPHTQERTPPPAAPVQPMMMQRQPPMPSGFQGKGPRVAGEVLADERRDEASMEGFMEQIREKELATLQMRHGISRNEANALLMQAGENTDVANRILEQLEEVTSQGFPRANVVSALVRHGGDKHKAIGDLLPDAAYTHIDASMALWNCTRKVSPGWGNCLFATHEAATKLGYGGASGRWAREQVINWVKTHPEECRDRIPDNLSNAEWVAKYEKDGEYADEFSVWVLSRVFHQNIHVMQVRDDAPDRFYTNSLLNSTVRMIYEPERRNPNTGKFVGGHYDLAEQQWRDVWDHDLSVLIERGAPEEYARNALMNTNGDMAAAVAALDNLIKLIEIGFDAERSKNALQDSNDDVDTAIDMMMSY